MGFLGSERAGLGSEEEEGYVYWRNGSLRLNDPPLFLAESSCHIDASALTVIHSNGDVMWRMISRLLGS